MKAIALTTALIAAISAPAFAGSQLEKTLGVEPGVYTNAQLVAIKTAHEQTGSEATLYFGSRGATTVSSAAAENATAAAILDSITASADDAMRLDAAERKRNVLVSDGHVNERAADIFAGYAVLSDGPNS